MRSMDEGSDLGVFVRALAVTSKRLAAYPSGHPALAGAIEEAHRRLEEMAGATGELVVAVSSDGLIFGDEKLESPHARRIAAALYPWGVAAVRLERGIQPAELELFLRVLGGGRTDASRLLWEDLVSSCPHVRIQQVDFSAVRLTEEVDLAASAAETARGLWDEILRRLLAGEIPEATGSGRASGAASDGSSIDSLIERYLRETRTEGGLEQRRLFEERGLPEAAARRLETGRGSGRPPAVDQVAALIRALPRELADRVFDAALRAVAGDETAGGSFEALTATRPPEATLRALKKLGAEGVRLSRHALKYLERLSAISAAADGPEAGRPSSGEEPALAELAALLRQEDIDRFNPEDHRALLDHASVELPGIGGRPLSSSPGLGERIESLTEESLSEQLFLSLLELLGRRGSSPGAEPLLDRLEGLFRLALVSERIDPALRIVEGLAAVAAGPGASAELAGRLEKCLGRLADSETIAHLIRISQRMPEEAPVVRRLIERLGSAATANLLAALMDEADQVRRRHVFDMLASLGPPIVPETVRHLADPRWFVVRNMIVLLRTVGDRSSLPQVRRAAYHPDLRVRLEAIKSLFAFEARVPLALLARAINDPDPKLAETAIVLSGEYGIPEAVGLLVRLLRRWDPLGLHRSIRLSCIRALGDLADAAALDPLDRYFKDWVLPLVAREERIAAWRSLENYAEPARRPFVRKGLLSRDPEVREICRRLERQGPSGPGEGTGESTMGRRARRAKLRHG
jgi:HEAT repeat protein